VKDAPIKLDPVLCENIINSPKYQKFFSQYVTSIYPLNHKFLDRLLAEIKDPKLKNWKVLSSLDSKVILLENMTNVYHCKFDKNSYFSLTQLQHKNFQLKEEVAFCYSDGRYVTVDNEKMCLKNADGSEEDSLKFEKSEKLDGRTRVLN
jgi:hypothetical protein